MAAAGTVTLAIVTVSEDGCLCLDPPVNAPTAKLPPLDRETYVPAAMNVVRRSQAWPGILSQERGEKPGGVNHPADVDGRNSP